MSADISKRTTSTSRQSIAGFSLKELTVILAVLFVLGGILFPSYIKARQRAKQNACLANLKQMSGAVVSWALENKKEATDKVDVATICTYLKGGTLPRCPAGGVYSLSIVGSNATCAIPGHALPPGYSPKAGWPPPVRPSTPISSNSPSSIR